MRCFQKRKTNEKTFEYIICDIPQPIFVPGWRKCSGVLIYLYVRKWSFSGEGYGEVTLDNVNAMLSFVYSLLAGMCGTVLEAVGLDFFIRIDCELKRGIRCDCCSCEKINKHFTRRRL